MTNKKDLIIVALATFCLTATLFAVLPTRSQEPGQYDPWIDNNDDGTVDILDAINLANVFMTSGDPARNVTIVGHANKLAYFVIDQTVAPHDQFATPWISVDGYSKMTISIFSSTFESGFGLYATHYNGTIFDWGFLVDYQYDFGNCFVKSYDVPNEMIKVSVLNGATTAQAFWIDVYLIP